MGIGIMAAAILALVSAASAEGYGHPTAFVVSPIHEAQIVRGDDGMDHVEYDLLIVSVLPEPVTLSSVTVLDPAGKELIRIEGAALAAVTQPLFAHTKTTEIPASAAVAVEVDLILPPDTAPERLTHRIAYALKAGSVLAPMYDNLEVDAPDVTIARQPGMVLKPPVKGDGWLVSNGCCKPNLHRDLRVAIDGLRIELPKPSLSTGPRSRTAESSMATAARTNSITPSSRTYSRSPTEPSFQFRTASRRQPRTSQWFRKRTKTTAAIM
jgi:hypothetical protein